MLREKSLIYRQQDGREKNLAQDNQRVLEIQGTTVSHSLPIFLYCTGRGKG